MKQIPYIGGTLLSWKESFEFYTEIKVRFGETDPFGHLNHANAFVYFEEARNEFLKNRGILYAWLDPRNDAGSVVASIQCDFLKQVYFDQRLKLYVKVNKVGNASIEFYYMALNEQGEICFTGRNTQVQFSKSTGRSIPLGSKLREELEALTYC